MTNPVQAHQSEKSRAAWRVLHCPELVGGNPIQLAKAERELGLRSWALAFKPSPFQYDVDEVLLSSRASSLKLAAKRWQVLARALKDFDILHFNFGQTIMPPLTLADAESLRHFPPLARWLYQQYTQWLELTDLPLLKRLGKGIVVTFQGDDARQGDFCRTHFPITFATEVPPTYYTAQADEHKRWRIAQFAKYADRIFALNPDLLHVLPPNAQFLPYSHIDLRKWLPVASYAPTDKPPVVVHAPSNRGVKGTRFVLEAVERLKSEGLAIDFILVEGLPHAEARQLYLKADLLIDQLLAGWYGALAVELMALGKPVICYIREDDLKFIPAAMRADLPLIQATPETLYATLKTWLTTRRAELPTVGQRGRAYVERWHDPLQIAGRMQAEYNAIMAAKQAGRK